MIHKQNRQKEATQTNNSDWLAAAGEDLLIHRASLTLNEGSVLCDNGVHGVAANGFDCVV